MQFLLCQYGVWRVDWYVCVCVGGVSLTWGSNIAKCEKNEGYEYIRKAL